MTTKSVIAGMGIGFENGVGTKIGKSDWNKIEIFSN
jgi:hypothetical protein